MIKQNTLKNKVYKILFDMIITGNFLPGERLVEEEISKSLGTSRNPVREAIKDLEAQKLVTITPYRGATVSQISYEEANDLLELITVMEEYFCSKAAVKLTNINSKQIKIALEKYEKALNDKKIEDMMRLDFEFHTIIAKLSGNQVAVDVYNNLRSRMNIVRIMTLPYFDRGILSFKEHQDIANALAERNPDKASEASRRHMIQVKSALHTIKDKEIYSPWRSSLQNEG